MQPVTGRFFIPGDDTAEGSSPVAVLSHDLWQRSFGGNSDAVGRPITINGSAVTVVGVAPDDFRGLDLTDATALWVPLSMLGEAVPRRAGSDILTRRGSRWLWMVGRLATGATLGGARAEIATITAQLAQAYPASNLGTLETPDQA